MTQPYDLDASRRRLERAEKALVAQQVFIAKQTYADAVFKAAAKLVTLHASVELARRNYTVCMDRILEIDDDA